MAILWLKIVLVISDKEPNYFYRNYVCAMSETEPVSSSKSLNHSSRIHVSMVIQLSMAVPDPPWGDGGGGGGPRLTTSEEEDG